MKSLIIFVLGATIIQANHDVLREYTNGNLKFSANIYKEMLKTNSGNFLVCPMSVETVFALMHSGAVENTAAQIASGFHFPNDHEKIQNIYKELSPKLQHTGEYNLSSANKIYVKDDFNIKEGFINIATDVFNAEIQKIDFKKKKEAVEEINSWVEEKTFNKIRNLLQSEDISSYTKMVLVNAMYFKGKWVHTFRKDETKKQKFYLNDKDTVDVDMMENVKSFKYHECKETNSKFLEMPFYGSDVSMVIVLPNEKEGLAHLEENLEKVLKEPKYQYEKVHLRLPKFEMNSKIEFIPILKELGVKDAFEETAKFTNIYDNPKETLQISKVVQKAFIKVEERGTTAAAATAAISIVTITASVPPPPVTPKEFFADHPFIYILKNTNGIMFIGRYVSDKK